MLKYNLLCHNDNLKIFLIILNNFKLLVPQTIYTILRTIMYELILL